jgi:hypothetical protein
MRNIMSDLEFEALNADIRGEGEWDGNEYHYNGNVFEFIPANETSHNCDLMVWLRANLPEDFGRV